MMESYLFSLVKTKGSNPYCIYDIDTQAIQLYCQSYFTCFQTVLKYIKNEVSSLTCRNRQVDQNALYRIAVLSNSMEQSPS
jgi:hypothetical protein